ncbi:MAG: phosphotransferase family protein [Bacteroidota bacterium]
MLKNVRPGEELSKEKVKSFLLENDLISDPKSELNVRQYATGFSNLTYLLEIEDRDFVLRRPPKGAIKRGHDMGREYKVLSRLNRSFAKAPKAYVYTEDVEVIGAPFYLMEKVEGIILTATEAKKQEVTAPDFKKISDCWLDTFVELHQLDYQAIGLGDLGRPEGYVERQVRNWSKQYLKAATEDIPEAAKVMTWLDENQPREYDHCLIHNDYKYDNVVFQDNSWQSIRAVLDWEMCTLGDPLMDLGTSLAYRTSASDHPLLLKSLPPSATQLPGNPSRTDLVEQYATKSGRSVDNLVFYYAYGLFKVAVIVQQIYYRYHHGMTSNEKFAKLNQVTRLFCTMAAESIERKQIENIFFE